MSQLKDLKFVHKHVGYYGEQCYKMLGIRFIKRLVNRTNRHVLNSQLKKEWK